MTSSARQGSSGSGVSEGRREPVRRRRDREVAEAAIKVFHERGYSDATVQDIADELGILKGSLYHYIDTKEDLLFAICESIHDDIAVILDEIAAAEGLAPLERLKMYVLGQVRYDLAHLAAISVYYHDMDLLTDERRRTVRKWRREISKFVTDLIRDAQKTGEVDPKLDASILANCLFGTIIWAYRWYKPNGRPSATSVADTCAAYTLAALTNAHPRR